MKRRPTFLGSTAIAGAGMTELCKESGRTVLDQAAEACRRASDDAGVPLSEIDGVLSYSFNNDSVPAQAVASTLALGPQSLLLDAALGGQAPCLLVMQAAAAIQAGLANNVLVYRALNGRSGSRVGTARVPGVAADLRYEAGVTAYAQIIAMWARRYLIATGQDSSVLGAVPIAERRWAKDNSRAIQRRLLSSADYLNSPMVADPFRAADCTSEVDGACAVLVTSSDRARHMRHDPVLIEGAAYVAGRGVGIDPGDALLWDDLSKNYTNQLASRLWTSARMGPDDMDAAQIYDCFSTSVYFALEGLGLTERGEAPAFVNEGNTSPGGRLPTNTSGGLLCEGYLHGMNTLAEAVWQLQGCAGVRTVDADTCVVTSGALSDGSALVLARGRR